MTDPVARLTAALADRYRIERELGAGGMATVYLAEDLRHDRKVAIKVLRPELSAVIGAERFVREIKTIAGLQHPHILGLIDSGALDGTAFYVMPFVDGESLRQRLQREKQLPVPEAVRLAGEVASALDYAHRQGVIHRDIKPENILLHDGRALVADFGIALAMSSAGGTRMTETGMSLGTPTYMSPEQAMGEREITAKSDVYALGCVLYEMLVGEPPFTGPTAQAIVAKVMSDEPRPPSQLRRTVPAALERVTLTALAKLPADRFASAGAMGEALVSAARDPGGASGPGPAPRTGASLARRVAAAGLLVALGALGATVVLRPWQGGNASGAEQRQQATYSGRAASPAISADGRFLAYLERRCPVTRTAGGCMHLMVVEVGGTRPVEVVSGAERLSRPRWTHDGLAIVFAGSPAAGRSGLFLVPRLGGIPRRLADEPIAHDTHASADSVAMLFPRDSGAVLEVLPLGSSSSGGTPVQLSWPATFLAWSPDGGTFALTTRDSLVLIGRDGQRQSARGWQWMRSPVRWSAAGHALLSFRWTAGVNDDLVAFAVDRAGRIGEPTPLVSQLQTLFQGEFDLARATGRIVVGSGSEFSDIWSFDLSGGGVRAERLTQGTNWHGVPVVTADGRALYYLRADQLGNSLYRIVDGTETALTAEEQIVNNALRLSLDGRAITFESHVDSMPVLMVHDVTSGTTRRVSRGLNDSGWLLPGGERIVWFDATARRIWITDAEGRGGRDAVARPVGVGSSEGGHWGLSPDGDALVTATRTLDATVIEVLPFDDGPARRLGSFPLGEGAVGIVTWARDGTIHLARANDEGGGVTIFGIDATSGAPRPGFVLPVGCDPLYVSYAPGARRAACQVPDRRLDLTLLDGVRP